MISVYSIAWLKAILSDEFFDVYQRIENADKKAPTILDVYPVVWKKGIRFTEDGFFDVAGKFFPEEPASTAEGEGIKFDTPLWASYILGIRNLVLDVLTDSNFETAEDFFRKYLPKLQIPISPEHEF